MDLQRIVDQAAGRTIELDSADLFTLSAPTLKLAGQVELYGNGATVTHDHRWDRKSAPLVSGGGVTGLIDGLVLVGNKRPDQGYVASREGHAGYWFVAPYDLTISNTQVLHVAGDFAMFRAHKTGTKKAGTLTHYPARNVTLDGFTGIDAGRHAVAACGVESLTIKKNCSFLGWRRARIDREPMTGFKTPLSAIADQGATWRKKG